MGQVLPPKKQQGIPPPKPVRPGTDTERLVEAGLWALIVLAITAATVLRVTGCI